MVLMAALNGVKMVLNYEVILVSRLFCGILAGMLNTIYSKLMVDSIPNEVSQEYGLSQNGGFGIGIFVIGVV